MNIIAFNCNPNKGENIENRIFSTFLDGMKESQANIDYYSLNNLDIKPCKACTTNIGFISNNGCCQQDSMQELYPKLKSADIWVFASPTYKSFSSATFKNLLDRLEPIFETPENFGNELDNSFYRSNSTPGKVILLSTNKDATQFKLIVEEMRMLADIFGKKFLTPILRNNCEILEIFELTGNKQLDNIYKALKEAGKQAVNDEDFDENTVKTISRHLVNDKSFIKELANIAEEILT